MRYLASRINVLPQILFLKLFTIFKHKFTTIIIIQPIERKIKCRKCTDISQIVINTENNSRYFAYPSRKNLNPPEISQPPSKISQFPPKKFLNPPPPKIFQPPPPKKKISTQLEKSLKVIVHYS